ncbi:MAG: TolC family protein, partial [Deltaproteobacteria bacterium]|nr:TolC family protein [Deltaproteobacteria bacterium]
MTCIKRIVTLGVFFCFALSQEAHGEELRLSLRGGMRLALENNLDIKIGQVSPEIEAQRIRKEEGIFDPEFSTSFKFTDQTTPLTTRSTIAAGGQTSVKSESYSLSAGLSGKTIFGTGYSLALSDTWTSDTFNRYDYEYDSFAGITLTQPLLKNLGKDINRYTIETAGKEREMSVFRLKSRINDVLANYALAYWDLVFARAELRVREDNLSLAQALLGENKNRFEAGVVSRLDVIQAEAGAAKRKEDVIMAKKTVREKENGLKRFISADLFSLKDTEIVPTDEPLYEETSYTLEQAVKEAFALRPDYMETRTGIEKNRIKVAYSKNQTYPSVDLEASYGFSGLGEDFGDSINGMDTNPQWSAGLVFTYPFGNRAADSGLRIARLEEAESLIRLK